MDPVGCLWCYLDFDDAAVFHLACLVGSVGLGRELATEGNASTVNGVGQGGTGAICFFSTNRCV